MTARSDPLGLICLGASAGGLRSLEAVVSRLPADLPWPVLISQHLPHDRVSQMPEILARLSTLHVRQAVEGEELRAGTIYTSPGDAEMGITPEGTVSLRAPVEGRPQSIDHLFATAAFTRPGRVVAVILSGTGSDGAVGSLVVKLNGGTVVAESDESAQHTAMPAAAHRAGTVDVTLPASDIAALLVELARGGLDEASAATRAILGDIADTITDATGTDFARYRLGTLRRRAEKRRAIVGAPTLQAYHDRIASDPIERDAFVRSLLVPVTEFFRDPPAWQALETHVMPRLAERARAGKSVRIWCAGCGSGEEAYTIAILATEAIADPASVRIVATDLDAEAIGAASEGTYDGTRMAGVDTTRRARFFRARENAHQVNDELRRMIQFRTHDLTRDPAPGEFDLIVCRNLLIYFEDDLQARTVAMFRNALATDGVLFLGRSEAIPKSNDTFEPLVGNMRIFRAKGTPKQLLDDPSMASVRPSARGGRSDDLAARVRVEEPDAIVLDLDASWRVTAANARARVILDRDVVGMRLLDVFPSWQGSPVHDALRASFNGGRSLKVRGAPTPRGRMDITLERLPGTDRGILLIGLPAAPSRMRSPPSHDPQEVREDLATTNEELQSANEELAATNEELQAANEELASLNEEFQSANEELGATNVELQSVAQSSQPTTDLMRGILDARSDAIVACDASGRVTLYNRKAAELFGLDPSFVGRSLPLPGLGPMGADIAGWLERAKKAPEKRRVEHGPQKLDLTIEHMKSRAGASLGWVLTWAQRA